MIIYAPRSAHEKFSIRIKSLQSQTSRPGQAGRKAELFQIETADLDWFRRQTFQVLKLVLGTAHEKSVGTWLKVAP